jgi:hypothetical protein
MTKVTVYRFTVYDITTDESRLSRRMGMREAIAWAKGSVVEEASREVDEADLGREVPGMTERDFWVRSDASDGFQRAVTR